MKQEVMGWQWHQFDHMQIICTSRSLQTDNHVLHLITQILYRLHALPDAQPPVSKH